MIRISIRVLLPQFIETASNKRKSDIRFQIEPSFPG